MSSPTSSAKLFEGGRVVAVCFVDRREAGWRPFHITTLSNDGRSIDYYDVDWCERDQQSYFHWSGGGGRKDPAASVFVEGCSEPNVVWSLPGVEVHENSGNPYPSTPDWPEGVDLEELEESSCRYCLTCDDFLPEDDLCDHVWWCEDCDFWAGAVHENCGCEARA